MSSQMCQVSKKDGIPCGNFALHGRPVCHCHRFLGAYEIWQFIEVLLENKQNLKPFMVPLDKDGDVIMSCPPIISGPFFSRTPK